VDQTQAEQLASLRRQLAEATRIAHHSANQTMECVQEIKRLIDSIDALRRSQDTANVINEGWKGAHEAAAKNAEATNEKLQYLAEQFRTVTGKHMTADLEDRKHLWKWTVNKLTAVPPMRALLFYGFFLAVIAILAWK
jgi:transcription termination factor NusB